MYNYYSEVPNKRKINNMMEFFAYYSYENCKLSTYSGVSNNHTLRAVARSENLGGHIVLGGDNVPPPLVEIGLTDL